MAIAARIIRFGLIGLAGFMGLFGIMFGIFILILHLASLRSFGMPYMSPLGPYQSADLKDSVFRFTWPLMKTRPANSKVQNMQRQDTSKRGESPNEPKK